MGSWGRRKDDTANTYRSVNLARHGLQHRGMGARADGWIGVKMAFCGEKDETLETTKILCCRYSAAILRGFGTLAPWVIERGCGHPSKKEGAHVRALTLSCPASSACSTYRLCVTPLGCSAPCCAFYCCSASQNKEQGKKGGASTA